MKSVVFKSTLMAAAAVLPLMGHVAAQDAEASVSADEIIVTGFRLENRLAIAAKRENRLIADFLAADEINRSPDFNIADAFRRISGVNTIADEDEGRYVALRGLNPDFTFVTIDDGGVAALDLGGDFGGGRRVLLEVIPSSAVSRIDVLKSSDATLDGQGIGGHINLVTRSAFDVDDTFFVVNGFVGYFDSQDVPISEGNPISFRTDATFTKRFGANGEFGVVASGSYQLKRRDQERVFFNDATYLDEDLNSVTPTEGDSSLVAFGTIVPLSYRNNVTRRGGLIKLEHSPVDAFYQKLQLNYFEQIDDERRNDTIIGGGTAVSRTADSVNVEGATRQARLQDWQIEKHVLHAQYAADWAFSENDDLSIKATYSNSRWYEDAPRVGFRSSVPLDYNVRLGVGDGPVITTVNNPDSGVLDPSTYGTVDFPHRFDDETEDLFEAKVDYAHNLGAGDLGFGVRAGLKFRRTEREFDRDVFIYGDGPNPGEVRLVDVQQENLIGNSYSAPGTGLPQLFIDIDEFLEIFNNAAPGDFALNEAATASSNTQQDFLVEEEVASAYAQAAYRTDRLALAAGLRIEETSTDTVSPVGDASGDTVAGSSSYVTLLPSASATYDLADDMIVRLSYSRNVGRPDFRSLAGVLQIDVEQQGVTRINQGNPDLRPRISDNIDFSLEKYFDDGDGLVAFGIFHKEISDNIFTRTTVSDDGLTIINQPENVLDASVSGIEFTIIKNSLDFLPRFLHDFGFSGNVTLISAEQTIDDDGTTINFLNEQPERLANAQLFYDNGAFDVRLTYNHTGQYATTVNINTPARSRYESDQHWVNLFASYEINDNFRLVGDIRNLFNADRRTVLGPNLDWTRDFNSFGRAFHVGFTYNY